MKVVDTYTKIVLTVIAVCLVVLVARLVGFVPVAHADDVGKLQLTSSDPGMGVACSADGKYVFVGGARGIARSEEYGRIGSWEKVVKVD